MKRTPRQKNLPGHAADAYERIKDYRKKLDTGSLTKKQFHRLLEAEVIRNEWASRVQLQSIARDLLPTAAAHARKGRSRLLAVVANILLKTEMSEAGDAVSQQFEQFIITHNVPRPDKTPIDRSTLDPALEATVEEMVTETLEKKVGQHADEHTTKH